MPWELTIVNYDGKPPRLYVHADKARQLPLGTLEEVRKHLSAVLPALEWYEDPPLIEMMKAAGSNLWETWDERTIASASRPKLRALYQEDELSLEMFGFEQDAPLHFVLLDVRGRKNPIPILRALCEPKGWSLAEMGKDGEFLDLSGNADRKWDDWQRFLKSAIDQTKQDGEG
jgi:hypothetical protein